MRRPCISQEREAQIQELGRSREGPEGRVDGAEGRIFVGTTDI